LIYEALNMAQLMSRKASLAEIVDDVYGRPLAYPPGTDQRYSDLGYALAARIASVTMQDEFHDLMNELLLTPAGLASTYFPAHADTFSRIANITGVYNEGTDGAIYNSAYSRGLAHPAFGVVATLRDLLAFGMLFTLHSEQRVLSSAAIRTMTSDQTGGDEPGERVIQPTGVIHPWGIGFELRGRSGTRELVSPSSFGHGGATGCVLWIDPVLDMVVAFVSNRHYSTGPEAFTGRLNRVVNVAAASLT
jgi:CubicO group peptidase (beta-lactamase class C family)